LPQDLQDMAAELGEIIQEEHAMVGQRHAALHRHVPGRSTILRRSYPAACRLGGLPHGRLIWSAADLRVLPLSA
jgi:hypothetical protein